MNGAPSADISLFLVEGSKWVLARILEEPPTARSSHCATVFKKKLLVFGGTSRFSSVDSQLHMLETDQIYTSARNDVINGRLD